MKFHLTGASVLRRSHAGQVEALRGHLSLTERQRSMLLRVNGYSSLSVLCLDAWECSVCTADAEHLLALDLLVEVAAPPASDASAPAHAQAPDPAMV